jgi:hypothetical protein
VRREEGAHLDSYRRKRVSSSLFPVDNAENIGHMGAPLAEIGSRHRDLAAGGEDVLHDQQLSSGDVGALGELLRAVIVPSRNACPTRARTVPAPGLIGGA